MTSAGILGGELVDMGRRLWFIGKSDDPISVFPSQRSARYELDAMIREDERAERYDIYPVEVDDLEEHPAEMKLAEEEGLI